ncbi:MAG: chloride channel protein [Verrucomicrobiota bacterium]
MNRIVSQEKREARSIIGMMLTSVFLAVVVFGVAELLLRLIDGVTQLAYYGQFSWAPISPVGHALGWWAVGVPVVGGMMIGLMARYGSEAIRGHGIPEAMIQVLSQKSRISPKVALFKPLSAAISIGTGGPFGAEGPIIATGGALGSLSGQIVTLSANERKTLLAAGAAAGMTAIFGTPIAAILLSIELLLFEFRMRSIVPVAVAVATSMALRQYFHGMHRFFPLALTEIPTFSAWGGCVIIGVVCGIAAAGITAMVYWLEDQFEKLPIHWMWWPAMGAVVVGLIGHFFPETLGVGYQNIERILAGKIMGPVVIVLCLMKFISWWAALSSGTSGGTLAPLLTVGAGLGQWIGSLLAPIILIDLRLAALVGMGALFAGASRAMLASALFAVEATGAFEQSMPVLLCCSISWWIASTLKKHSIMTEKIERRGHIVPLHYDADDFMNTKVGALMDREVPLISGDRSISSFVEEREQHREGERKARAIVDSRGFLCGVVTDMEILQAMREGKGDLCVSSLGKKEVITVMPDETLHDAAEKMLVFNVGRLIVVDPAQSLLPIGYLGRKEFISGRQRRLLDEEREKGWL